MPEVKAVGVIDESQRARGNRAAGNIFCWLLGHSWPPVLGFRWRTCKRCQRREVWKQRGWVEDYESLKCLEGGE